MSTASTIQRDLSRFADPATDFKVSEATSGVRLQLVRNGVQQDYFISSDGSVIARHTKNRRYTSLRSLIASPEFADIRGFATTQARLYKDFDIESLIPPEGVIDGKRLAQQTLHRAMIPHSTTSETSKLSVILLDGPAGIGKTSLIKKWVVQRARGQSESGSAPPILHVANRGRRLAALDDALAQSLQILRAQFTFDQVPALLRHSLIQLAIDGFDELVDPEGYKDAWYALRDFFDATQYGGPIVLAGRDTFFDEQSFSAQMKDAKQEFEMTHVRLGAVSPSNAKSWLAKRGWTSEVLNDTYTDIVLRPGSYALRPYFLNELAEAKGWEKIESCDSTPRAYLVDRFLTREAALVGQGLVMKQDEIKSKLGGLFEEIAMEMADNETDVVDLSFLQMVTEIAFGESLKPADVAKLRHKSGSFALLISDAREGFRRFPHTEISHHFLALALIRLVSAGAPLRFLRRGIATPDLLTILGELVMSQTETKMSEFVNQLEYMNLQEASFDRLPDNVSSILMTCLCRSLENRPRHYCDLQVPNAVLFGDVAEASLERIRIQRLVAEEAALSRVSFDSCEIVDLFVDETTRFGKLLPKVHRIHRKDAKGQIHDIFDPAEIEAWLNEHSEISRPQQLINREAIHLLDRVCRIMLRQHMIKLHEDDDFGRVLMHPLWARIEEILSAEGLVDRLHHKQMAGARAPFIRMRNPYELLANRNAPQMAAIWNRVGALAND